jgi:hypothetical protein
VQGWPKTSNGRKLYCMRLAPYNHITCGSKKRLGMNCVRSYPVNHLQSWYLTYDQKSFSNVCIYIYIYYACIELLRKHILLSIIVYDVIVMNK